MLDLLGKGTDRGYSMIGVGLSAGLSGSRQARTVQDPLPALDLDWATNRSLPASYGPTPSFSRASSGTYFDGQGILKSAAVNGPRFNHVFNGTSWVSRGLLVEEQRTQRITYTDFSSGWTLSGSTGSASAGTSPDGTNNAYLIYPSSTGTFQSIYQASGASNCVSIFAKASGMSWLCHMNIGGSAGAAWFNLLNGTVGTVASGYTASIANCGNGWYRCSVSHSSNFSYLQPSATDGDNTSTGTANGTNGILLYGPQTESGAFPTSFIPNLTSSSVTRSADVCQITGSDFSGFWNGTEGSVAVEFDQLADASKMTNESYIYGFQNAADTEQFILRGQSSGVYYWRSVNSGNIVATAQISSLGTATVKHAACYKLNDFASTFNGAAVVSDTSGATPNPTSLGIGFYFPTSSNRINGHIARLRYYPTRLTNAKLQELST